MTKKIPWLSPATYSESTDYGYPIKYDRSPALTDLGRMIHLIDFRKIANITQVHKAGDHVFRNRMTHSLEVSNVGLQLARMFMNTLFSSHHFSSDDAVNSRHDILRDVEDLTRFACLAHDIGHPPFAHSGEKILSDMVNFDSNINNLRILSGLSPATQGEKFTAQSIDSSLKKKNSYKFTKEESKKIKEISLATGTYLNQNRLEIMLNHIPLSSKKYLKEINNLREDLDIGFHLRNPISYIMEAADDISYLSADIEDALHAGIVSVKSIKKCLEKADLQILLDDINPGRIKTPMIQHLIEHLSYTMQEISKELNMDLEKKGSLFSAMEALPLYLHLFLTRKNIIPSEKGNILYVSDIGENLDNFKLNFYELLLSSKKILDEKKHARKVMGLLIDKLIPKNLKDRREVLEKSSFLTGNPLWRQHVIDALNNDKLESVQSIFLDYISSLSEGRATKLYKSLQ